MESKQKPKQGSPWNNVLGVGMPPHDSGAPGAHVPAAVPGGRGGARRGARAARRARGRRARQVSARARLAASHQR